MSLAVGPDPFVRLHDTYSIGLHARKSILQVSDIRKRAPYHVWMTKKAWESWGRRFKEMAKDNGHTLASLAETLELTEAALRHWTNGTREINLSDFFALCEAAKVDPSQALFGAITMDPETQRQLGEIAKRVLEADPAASPDYEKMTKGLRKKIKV